MEKYLFSIIFLRFLMVFASELLPTDPSYQKLKNEATNGSLCFGGEAVNEQTNIRSMLECSVKCSQHNPSFYMVGAVNATCNAFNYVTQDDNTSMCQLHHVESRSDNFPTFQVKNCRGYFAIVDSPQNNPNVATVSASTATTATASASLLDTSSTSDTISTTHSATLCPRLEFYATTEAIYLIFPNATSSTTLLSVNGWIVVQQRVDGAQSFSQSWASYKAHSANYRLRFEVLINGYWMSDEYDSFKAQLKYAIHASGYCGNHYDVLNMQLSGGIYVVNGMKFSTPDQDNTSNLFRWAQSCLMGYWINTGCIGNLNGIYDNSLLYYDARINYWLPASFCRIMTKIT
ncbi:hypothetical protein HELRODRAFT_174683 [Helobdella robusta]|uniref:Fibrinogen C-terminal domain-containing protein n=1 Tax=Helobdella robusta TaxID=6412 RepID=T1F8D3_HELRO|nr:hypothetical protein HELRODRAFT_174683 [Helobdella robusta]ESO01711.1 hypothetical protein HELRODRAFT_174683 [Helobdella robusta]